MSNVIPLPWVALGEPDRSIVIRTKGRRTVVAMQPAVTGREKRVRETFDSPSVARAYARRIHAMYPALYRRVIDETGDAA